MSNSCNIYIISDLHLSISVDKPMDIFGEGWTDYMSRLKEEWSAVVKTEDIVIIPGDISWGMTLSEALADLQFLNELPGKKILMKGNHDYWWTSLLKLNNMKAEHGLDTLEFMQTSSLYIEECDTAVVGTRGWKYIGDEEFSDGDLKIYKRELIRFEMSIKDSQKHGASNIICIFHYPPFNAKTEASGFTELMKKYGIEKCFFGHLHGIKGGKFLCAEDITPYAVTDGIDCRLISADYVSFKPVKIL
ncbi:MAG: serine/threonine protein phosphatase [Ruminococcaceae bacterium]|nr:serine/threonine protein phosphatase [Oscillospiraceae bacterium]